MRMPSRKSFAVMVLLGALVAVGSPGGSDGAEGSDAWKPKGVSQGSTNPASVASQDARWAELKTCLRSDDWIVRRRAGWRMAEEKVDPIRIVDAILSDRNQYGYGRLIINHDEAVLPRLYRHLVGVNADARDYVLLLIAIAGQPDADARAELNRVLEKHPDDKVLKTLAELARGGSPKNAAACLKVPGTQDEDSPLDVAEWLLLSHEKTRGPAVHRARTRLAEAVGKRRSADANQGQVERELVKGLFALAFATRYQALERRETECLKELQSELGKPADLYNPLMPAAVMTEWAAGGRKDPQLLDKALSLFGEDVTGCEARVLGGLILTFGDIMLVPDDVPVLISRASDPRAEEQIRVGAMRLVAWLAPADARVCKVYHDLLKSESEREPIRLVAAEGIAILIERRDGKGELLATAKARLAVEKSQSVRHALQSSIKRLAACP